MASFAGNTRVDTDSILDAMAKDIDNVITTKLPYIKIKKEDAESSKSRMDVYFEQLAEFEKELKEKKEQESNKNGNGKT